MTALSIQPTFPIFTDIDGQPLEDGYVFIGTANLNPITNPITVYWDAALTLTAVQPIRTLGGYPMNSGTPARLYVNSDYSIQVQNKNGSLIYSALAAGDRFSDVVVNGIDSSEVTFLQAGTGAVTRTAQAKMRDTVSVKDFGAVGDGAANDTAAIQAAVNSLSTTGGELFFPPGTYRITAAISKTFADSIVFSIRGYGAKIDATALTTGNAIELGGSRVSNTPLGGNVSKNSDTFTVTSATGISAGRILLITSTDLWNPTRPYYYKGELSLVEKIVGTTVTNSNPLYDGYTAATTTVHLLNMPTISVEGLEIECNADMTALQILYARNPVVRNCKVHGSRYAGIYVGYHFGGTADSNFVYDVWNSVVTGTSYGISVGTGQGFKVVNNTINNARHSIAGGGFEPLRETVYANNTCHNSTLENVTGSIDIHGNMEFSVVTGNVASSITCAGINAVISNNILNSAEADVNGILIFQEINSDYYLISGNRVSCAGASAYGCYVSPTVSNLNIKNLSFIDNDFSTVSNGIYIQPRNSGVTGCSASFVKIQGNKLTSSTLLCFLLNVNGAATYTVTNLLSSNNVYESVAYDAFLCVSGNPITLTQSVGDVFRANRLNGNVAQFGGTDVRITNPTFIGNTGGAGNSRAVSYINSGRIIVANPVFANMDFKAEISAATEYVENGWYSATPTINNAAGARLVNFYGALGRAVTYGTAAPTTGTWAVGDRVFNQTPAVGQPKSWVCTVAGTPGTWVSEGNL
jgi:hypothetical protein